MRNEPISPSISVAEAYEVAAKLVAVNFYHWAAELRKYYLSREPGTSKAWCDLDITSIAFAAGYIQERREERSKRSAKATRI